MISQVFPVHEPKIDGFGQMVDGHYWRVLQVGNSSADAQDPGVSPGRQAKFLHGLLQKVVLSISDLTAFVQPASGKFGIGGKGEVLIPFGLY